MMAVGASRRIWSNVQKPRYLEATMATSIIEIKFVQSAYLLMHSVVKADRCLELVIVHVESMSVVGVLKVALPIDKKPAHLLAGMTEGLRMEWYVAKGSLGSVPNR